MKELFHQLLFRISLFLAQQSDEYEGNVIVKRYADSNCSSGMLMVLVETTNITHISMSIELSMKKVTEERSTTLEEVQTTPKKEKTKTTNNNDSIVISSLVALFVIVIIAGTTIYFYYR